MSAQMTSISLQYRRRAAEAGRQAMDSADQNEMFRLLQQALSWIQLAENEEMLAQAPSPTGSVAN